MPMGPPQADRVPRSRGSPWPAGRWLVRLDSAGPAFPSRDVRRPRGSVPPANPSGPGGSWRARGAADTSRSSIDVLGVASSMSTWASIRHRSPSRRVTSGRTCSIRKRFQPSMRIGFQMPLVATFGPQSQPKLHAALRMKMYGAQSPFTGRAPSLASSARMCRRGEVNTTTSSLCPAQVPRTSNRCGWTCGGRADPRPVQGHGRDRVQPLANKVKRARTPGMAASALNRRRYSQSVSPIHCTSRSLNPTNGSGIRPARRRSVCTHPGTPRGCRGQRGPVQERRTHRPQRAPAIDRRSSPGFVAR